MLTQIQGPDHHFNAFYKNNAILIQFIVEEFIQSHQLTLQINTLIQEQLEFPQTLNSLSSSLIPILSQLVGCLSQQERSSSFSRWTKGPLTKFKEYCEHFSRNSSRCQADESLLADIMVKKFGDHLPLYRQSEIMTREGIHISRQTLCNWILHAG